MSPWWSISNDDEMIAPRILFCDYLICTRSTSELVDECIEPLAPVVRRLDNAIHWKNLYPVDNATDFLHTYLLIVIYPMDIAIQLSFEQLGPDGKNVRAKSESVDDLNALSPNIHIQILQTDFYTFP